MERFSQLQGTEERVRFSDLSIEELEDLQKELTAVNHGGQQNYYIKTINKRIKELKG